MYESITGNLTELTPTQAVVETGGIGYLLFISLETFSRIEHSEQVRLYVHQVVREDAQLLYGFSTKTERELFRLLISVSGVGGNTARMILSTFSPQDLQQIIATENAVLLKNVKGLGLKTAQKIIVELGGRVTSVERPGAGSASGAAVYEETMAALVMLGFQRTAADKAVVAVLRDDPVATVEQAVRAALKKL